MGDKQMRRRRWIGFTLVELLEVTAVIAVLAAVMFPVFSHVRVRALQASCASNLAQIARAGLMYVQDNDEHFPCCYWIDRAPYIVDYQATLQPYAKNWSLFYCPERRTMQRDCMDPKGGFHLNAHCMGYG